MSKQTILITGASSGFGHGAAKALAEKGHRIFASMRALGGKNADRAAGLRRWAEAGGHDLEVVEIDVADDASVQKGVAAAIARAGRIDVLVNNAGVGAWGLQEAFSPEQIHRLFDVNVVGPLRMNRAVLPHMRAAGGGYLIYLSSGLGRIQVPFLGAYAASKHAVEAIAESGSYELAPLGIETTIVQPGAYGTDFTANSIQPENAELLAAQPVVQGMFEGFAKGFEARARAGQLGDPQEIVDAIVALVESERGSRPLRKSVGEGSEGVRAINEACAAVQSQLLAAFGMG